MRRRQGMEEKVKKGRKMRRGEGGYEFTVIQSNQLFSRNIFFCPKQLN